MKHFKESWLHCSQQLFYVAKTCYNPHAAMLTGATLFVVWYICNLFSLFENSLGGYLPVILAIAVVSLYSLLCRKGDPFFLNLYKSSFMRSVLLHGRDVEISLYRSIPLSMLFSFFLVSLVILRHIEYADPAVLQGFRIPVLPYLVVRTAIALEGGVMNSVYMERIPYFHETHLLITSESAKGGQFVIGYCVSLLLLALGDLGNREKTRITAVKDSFLKGLHGKVDMTGFSQRTKSASSLLEKSKEARELEADVFDKIVDLSALAEEACDCATGQWGFTLGCKVAASTLGLCCSPLASFTAEISALGENPCVKKASC